MDAPYMGLVVPTESVTQVILISAATRKASNQRDNRAWLSEDWASTGCVRKTPLRCDAVNGSTDRFTDLGVTLPHDFASSHPAILTKKDCQQACQRNCSCTMFSFNPPSGPCQFWFAGLLNLRNATSSTSNSIIFVRVAASPLSNKCKSTCIMGATLGIIGALSVALVISVILIWRRHIKLQSMARRADSSDPFLRMFTYKELKTATRNFKSELGSGGFGSVFKGFLPDGTAAAIKKVKGSRQVRSNSEQKSVPWET